MRGLWDFDCDCVLCTCEAGDSAATQKHRENAREAAKLFCAKHVIEAADGFHSPSNIVMRKAEEVAKAIDATYDSKRYASIPKLVSSGMFLKTELGSND